MSKAILIGAPIDSGQRYPGCLMGPAAYRVAGLAQAIRDLGHGVDDWGDVALPDLKPAPCPNPVVHSLPETVGWTEILADRVDDALSQNGLPIIMGGDHSLALGSVAGVDAFVHRTETRVIKDSGQLKEELLAKLKEAMRDDARTIDADAEALMREIEGLTPPAAENEEEATPPTGTPQNPELS